MATIYDLSITQGSQLDVRLRVKDQNGNVINLENYFVRGYIKHRYADAGNLLNLEPVIVSGDGGSGYVSGYVDILVSGSQSATLPVSQNVYDIELYNAQGYTDKIIKGYFSVLPEVTTSDS
jgi:hypothetical protein